MVASGDQKKDQAPPQPAIPNPINLRNNLIYLQQRFEGA